MIKTKRGLDLPISGSPEQKIDQGRPARSCAVVGYDFPGLKPTMAVAEGDKVVAGQLLFTDKKSDGINYTAPASGTVSAIHRGAKRVFQSIVIDMEEGGDGEAVSFASYKAGDISDRTRAEVTDLLLESGEWTALRTRPYNKVPALGTTPSDIFVTAIDTRPLAADPSIYIAEQKEAFTNGLSVLAKLTDGAVFVCKAAETDFSSSAPQVKVETFSGPHPAGLVGTHIHFLSPVSAEKTVWHLGYQDVIAIGHLFASGKIYAERVVALAGPGVESPRLMRTVRGGSLDELGAGEYKTGNQRVLSGSVFDGRTAQGALAYLGRFHNQVSVLAEGTERELFGFVAPGTKKFSVTGLFMSSLFGLKNHDFTTSTGGSNRAMVPIGTYEKMMPLDILPTQLLRALLVNDVEVAMQLGCLELDEEDLALCTFACPGKYEYGPYLRQMLTLIEAEG